MNCMMEQTERQLQSLRAQIGQLGDDAASQIRREQLRRDMKQLLEACRTLSPADKVYLARHPSRPGTADYISALFTDFFEQQGDPLLLQLFFRSSSLPGGPSSSGLMSASMGALLCFTASR